MQNCSSNVTISSGRLSAVGGLIGSSIGAVSNSYAMGSVTLKNANAASYAGGLVGATGCFDGWCGTIASSYSTAAVTAPGGGTIGGLVGSDTTSGGISNAYWDTTTSGVTNPGQGAGTPANDPGITGLTTAQLQANLPPGFDPAVWGEDPGVNGGLPYLLANPPQ